MRRPTTLPRRRSLSALLGAGLFIQNLAAPSAEANFWRDRRLALNVRPAGTPAVEAALAPVDVFTGPPWAPEPLRNDPFLRALSRRWGRPRRFTPAEPDAPLVLLIEDAHRNADAQRNIAALVDAAAPRADLLALEGAEASFNAAPLRAYPDRAALQRASDFLLGRGELAGALHAALNHAGEFPPVQGVDDAALHRANVDAYRRSLGLKAAVRELLSRERRAVDADARRLFSPALRHFHQAAEQRRSGRQPLSAFLAAPESAPGLATGPFPNLRLFNDARERESRLDFAAASRERARVLDALTPRLAAAERDDLLARARACRDGDLSAGTFHDELLDLARRRGLDGGPFPALRAYVDYARRADRIDGDALFEELDRFEDWTAATLARSPAERALWDRSRRLARHEKLIDFALTAAEWRALRDDAERPAGPWAPFDDFYRAAEARDQALADRLLARLHRDGGRRAVLVAGGFHADGIASRLRAAGVSTLSVTPRIDALPEDGTSYLTDFSRERTPLEKLFRETHLFVAPDFRAGADQLPGLLGADLAIRTRDEKRLREFPRRAAALIRSLGLEGRFAVGTPRFERTDDGSTVVHLPLGTPGRLADRPLRVRFDADGAIADVGWRDGPPARAPPAWVSRWIARVRDARAPLARSPSTERWLFRFLPFGGDRFLLALLRAHDNRSLYDVVERFFTLRLAQFRRPAPWNPFGDVLHAAHNRLFQAALSLGERPAPTFPNVRFIVNMLELGNVDAGDHVGSERSLAKLRRRIPSLAALGVGELYLTNGLFAPDPLAAPAHTHPDEGAFVAHGGRAWSYISGYRGKRTQSPTGHVLDDRHGNNFCSNPTDINPRASDGDTPAERWAEFRDTVAHAHAHGLKVVVDLVPWPSPNTLAQTNDRYLLAHRYLEIAREARQSSEQLAREHPGDIVLELPNGRRVLVGKRDIAADQVEPDTESDAYFAFLRGIVENYIDHGVDGIRIDLIKFLFPRGDRDAANPHFRRPEQGRRVADFFRAVKQYAGDRGRDFLIDPEAYEEFGTDWAEVARVLGADKAYDMGVIKTLDNVHFADPGLLPAINAALASAAARDPGRHSVQGSNFDETSWRNRGVPAVPLFARLLVASHRQGLPVSILQREWLGEEGEHIPQAGGEHWKFGGFEHPFLNAPAPGYRNLLRRFRRSPVLAAARDLKRLADASGGQLLELNTDDPRRYFAVGARRPDGRAELRVYDFHPHWARRTWPWVDVAPLGLAPESSAEKLLLVNGDRLESLNWGGTGLHLVDAFDAEGVARYRVQDAAALREIFRAPLERAARWFAADVDALVLAPTEATATLDRPLPDAFRWSAELFGAARAETRTLRDFFAWFESGLRDPSSPAGGTLDFHGPRGDLLAYLSPRVDELAASQPGLRPLARALRAVHAALRHYPEPLDISLSDRHDVRVIAALGERLRQLEHPRLPPGTPRPPVSYWDLLPRWLAAAQARWPFFRTPLALPPALVASSAAGGARTDDLASDIERLVPEIAPVGLDGVDPAYLLYVRRVADTLPATANLAARPLGPRAPPLRGILAGQLRRLLGRGGEGTPVFLVHVADADFDQVRTLADAHAAAATRAEGEVPPLIWVPASDGVRRRLAREGWDQGEGRHLFDPARTTMVDGAARLDVTALDREFAAWLRTTGRESSSVRVVWTAPKDLFDDGVAERLPADSPLRPALENLLRLLAAIPVGPRDIAALLRVALALAVAA